MKITFPHLGDTHIAARLLLSEIGVEVVVPPLCSGRTLELGASISPDEICFPFKLMAGNLLQAWELGADTVVMPATMGPCRLGEYAELLNSVLCKAGCRFNWIVIDSPKAIGIRELIRRLSSVVKERDVSLSTVIRKLGGAKRLIEEIDALCSEGYWRAGSAENPKEVKTLLNQCRKTLIQLEGKKAKLKTGRQIVKSYRKQLADLPQKKDGGESLKLVVTGEIYTLIEPYANHRMEELLMDMGISFRKRVSISWWMNHTAGDFMKNIRKGKKNENPYLPYSIGGYAKETVEESFSSKSEGFDGVLQLLPVGCMPEIVAKAALERLNREEGADVMNIIFDEMDGQAGYITRIEAFADMLERKKRGRASDVLSRN